MEDVAIVGIGMHPWGKWPEKSFVDLGEAAAEQALADASLEWKDIPFVVSAMARYSGTMGFMSGNAVSMRLGNRGIPTINIWNACASGAYALSVSQMLVSSGRCDKVLCLSTDKSPDGFLGVEPSKDESDQNFQRFRLAGLTNPGWWALLAQRRMYEVGTTAQDLAQVKVKNSKHATLNPNTRYQKEYTLEQVMNSPVVIDPLRLYEICATSDGAAAVIVCSAKEARKYTSKPVLISAASCASYAYPEAETAAGMASDYVPEDRTASLGSMVDLAVKGAYEQSGIGPEDLSFAEVYDLATILELLWYEHIGICKYGEAEKLLREGATALGGRIPINTSGGVSSSGEVPPAQGLFQVHELVTQLRGDAGARQVPNAKVGLAANIGLGGNCSTVILKR